MVTTEKDWRDIFQVDLELRIIEEPGECGLNCQLAKELKCVCGCGGRNHGAALKKELKSLDEFTSRQDEAESHESPYKCPNCGRNTMRHDPQVNDFTCMNKRCGFNTEHTPALCRIYHTYHTAGAH